LLISIEKVYYTETIARTKYAYNRLYAEIPLADDVNRSNSGMGAKVPCHFCSGEWKFQGTIFPRSESTREQKFLGTPGSESTWERKFHDSGSPIGENKS